MSQKLTLKDDIMFKAFFSRNEKYLKSFLSAIMGKEIKIKKVMHDARLEQLTKEMKYGILDLEVELEGGEIVNIEMQLKDNKNIEKRTTFYASKKIVEQLEPREDFAKLKRVIVIAILNYTLTDLPEYVTETVRVCRNHKDYEMNNLAKYYYIELEKFRKSNPDMKEKVNQWLSLIDMERGDLLEMAKKENKEVKKAAEDFDVLTGDEEIKRLAEIRLMSILEEKSALATAKEKGTKEGWKQGIAEGKKKGIEEGKKKGIEEGKKQGIEEGKKQGIEEGIKQGIAEGQKKGIEEGKKKGIEEGEKNKAIEIAKKMKQQGMSIETIQEITNLDFEEIEKL